MPQARVAITGIGVVSTFGVGRDCYWHALRDGRSGTRAITDFDTSSFPCRVAAAVPPVDISMATPLAGEQGPRETRADPNTNDYNPPDASTSGKEKVFIWGRPAFVGAKATGQDAQVYLMVADLPSYSSSGSVNFTSARPTLIDVGVTVAR